MIYTQDKEGYINLTAKAYDINYYTVKLIYERSKDSIEFISKLEEHIK